MNGLMRAACAATALLALGATDAAGQRPIRFGIIGGYNMSGAYGDDVEGADTRSGYDIGGLVQIPFGEMITVQPEVHYTQKGYSSDVADVSLDYLQVPLLLRAGVPLAEGFDVDLQFGPSFGFLLGCETDPSGPVEAVDCDDEVKGFDWGIVGGGSFSWAAGPGDVLFDIRYDLGLTDIDDTEPVASVKNTNFQFLLGYAFPL